MELLHYNCVTEKLGNRYKLVRLLGSGGMADVYLAYDEQSGREVAIKVIRPEVLDARSKERFFREGRVIASLNHPHIIHMYGKGVQEDIFTNPDPTNAGKCEVPYIVMEYVMGGNLQKRLVPGQPYPLNETVCIFEQLCAAVQCAHNKRLIHRDIKPANILFRKLPQEGGQVEVILSDFGLAVADNATLSQPMAGTLPYMAREQQRGNPQQASDVFSLGVVLYQLCTGELPSPLQPPKKPTQLNPDLPPVLDDVILRALSNDPSQRFASASLFWQAIEKATKLLPPPKVPGMVTPAVASSPSRNTGNGVVAGAMGALAGAAAGEALSDATKTPTAPLHPTQITGKTPSAPARPTTNKTKIPAVPPNTPNGSNTLASAGSISAISAGWPPSGAGSPRRTPPANRNRRRILIVALVILVLLALGGLIASAKGNISGITATPDATVTITPASKTVQDNYVLPSVDGNSNIANRQVGVRKLSSNKSDTQQVKLARVHQDAKSATGTLTFSNFSPDSAKTVTKATVTFPVGNVQIAIDQDTTVPAGKLVGTTVEPGKATVSAHAVQIGVAGNIVANAINISPCCGTASVSAQNQIAFTGGQDAVGYNYLKPEDVNAVTNAN